MVVDSLGAAEVDVLFKALSDSTRRDILVRTLSGPQSISALARNYPISFAAVQKHVALLERAGLVKKERRGREQLVETNIEAVRQTQRLLEMIEELWRERLDRFQEVLEQGGNP
jgi:DNA-binding transcriptional ArsR family regulator